VREILAEVPKGIDNVSVGPDDRIFVSHYVDGRVAEETGNQHRILSEPGLLGPHGLALGPGGRSRFVGNRGRPFAKEAAMAKLYTGELSHRVVMNFYTAKRLMNALLGVVSQFENTYGVIELDFNRRARQAGRPPIGGLR
jgi:hypothetical protein